MIQIFFILLLLITTVITFVRLRKLVVNMVRSLFIGYDNEAEKELGYYFLVLAVLVLVLTEKLVRL
jgi:hypothetical protein